MGFGLLETGCAGKTAEPEESRIVASGSKESALRNANTTDFREQIGTWVDTKMNREDALAAERRGTGEELGMAVPNHNQLLDDRSLSSDRDQDDHGRCHCNRRRRVHHDA